ncbi:hypothetical protein BC936DRAFT_140402 [Jimgerdemannia flammicorona]|uniref:Uncharacterized protein n=1 Tax=Jimgerdemannia flammicorona TaxID=994334 RepID=A0A433AUC8_9FUNG|nr:hypothetical protein BC936DRAFT_140402 [Jimgerdemannia flammicorona]
MPGAEDYRELIQSLKNKVDDLQNENMMTCSLPTLSQTLCIVRKQLDAHTIIPAKDILAELEATKDIQKELVDETSYYQKKYAAIETELTAARNLHTRLETQIYAQEQDGSNLRKENQQLNKAKKDLEKKLSGEVGFFWAMCTVNGQEFQGFLVNWEIFLGGVVFLLRKEEEMSICDRVVPGLWFHDIWCDKRFKSVGHKLEFVGCDSLKSQLAEINKNRSLSHRTQQFENDRVHWQKREADLYNQIRTLSTNGLSPASQRRRSVSYMPVMPNGVSGLSLLGGISESESSPFPSSGSLASTLAVGNNQLSPLSAANPPSTQSDSYTREAKIASLTIKAQDKQILDLKNEVERQKSVAQENLQQVQRQAMKIEHLENEISNVKQVNRSLMEDNESYQILLHEKTMSGEFMLNPIMQNRFDGDDYDTLDEPRRKESNGSVSKNGLNLAAELNLASVSSGTWESVQKESETNLMVESTFATYLLLLWAMTWETK